MSTTTVQDLNELELPKTCKTEFPDPDDLLNFKLKIYPDEGFYKHGQGRRDMAAVFLLGFLL